MSGATFSRIKDWTTEILTNTDLNAEIDNILNHLDPTGVGDYSDTATMMRLQTDPGGLGTESLATSLAGELERLRFVLKRLIGTSVQYWYQAPLTDLTSIVNILGSQLFTTRIISGRTTGNSSQMCALIPTNGTGASAGIVLSAAGTPFIYCINGTNVTVSTNKTISGLSLASGANNTATGDTFVYAGAPIWTKSAGQYGNKIVCNSIGPGVPASGFTNLTGSFIAIQNVQSTPAEAFIAFMENSTCFTNAWRGCFFDQSASGIPGGAFSGSTTTFKLLKLTWLFADISANVVVTYNNPFVGAVQPTSPGTGDYWFDLNATAWKSFTNTSWAATNSLLIGMCAQDTAACIAARTFDSYAASDALNTLTLDERSNTTVRERGMFSQVNVFGTKINFGPTKTVWDTSLNLDPNTTMTVNTPYFMYLKENGTPLISDTAPQFRRELQGYYHPRETWRAVGSAWTDNSTNFQTPLRTFRGQQSFMLVTSPDAYLGQANLSAGQAVPFISPERFIHQNSSAQATFPLVAANTFYDLTTMSLTPGLWSISGMAELEVFSGTPAQAAWRIGFSVNATTSFSDRLDGYNCAGSGILNINAATGTTLSYGGYLQNISITDCWMEVTSPTKIYMKATCSATAASANLILTGWGMNARRLDDSGGI